MLLELAVQDLGVIEELRLLFGDGMTAVTGETGAGKTLVVEAIGLLMGGRADSVLVRAGAREAVVEGRFDHDGEEVVLTRVVAAKGRSRAYRDGRMVTVASLAELGAELVDLYGQHAHQSLLAAGAQRAALDAFAATDLAPLRTARAARRELTERLAGLGGDAGARARELDLLSFQLGELDDAHLEDPDEDDRLDRLEDQLADAVAHREAAAAAVEILAGEPGALDALGRAAAALADRQPFLEASRRLDGVLAELGDIASEIRTVSEAVVEDPERLAEVRSRRQLLHELRRKYGTASPGSSGTLADVLAYAEQTRRRAEELATHDELAARLDAELAEADRRVRVEERRVGEHRRAAAPELAAAVQAGLADLAMEQATLEVEVGEDPGDDVRFLLAANRGGPALPLAKVASGGELARTMLALRLVLTEAPPTLLFDEVDAGIGGGAAAAVGRALARLAATHQVLVVTHLAQVAALADHHVRVTKAHDDSVTVSEVTTLDGEERVVELSRMLSGESSSAAARAHVRELLDAGGRGGDRADGR